jgi:hypothetical protein
LKNYDWLALRRSGQMLWDWAFEGCAAVVGHKAEVSREGKAL